MLDSGSVEAQKLIFEAMKFGAFDSRSKRRAAAPVSKKQSSHKKEKKRKREEDEDEKEEEGKSKNTNGEPPKKKRRTGFNKIQVLSAAMAEFYGEQQASRPDVVKKLHAYIKEHSLQDKKDGRKINFDEKLQSIFKVKSTTFFKINKILSKHIKPAD